MDNPIHGRTEPREGYQMAYQRKTVDCYRFYCDYGNGWEHEITEYTRGAMKENRRAYLENSPYPLKIVKGREIISDTNREYIGRFHE